MSLTELMDQIEKLTPAEKRMVRERLVAECEVAGDEELRERHERMLKKMQQDGFLVSVPDRKNKPRRSRPVTITGKPLSESIIEDRR